MTSLLQWKPERINAFIAEHIMGEAKPPAVGEGQWQLAFDGHLAGRPLFSKGGNWRCDFEFESGDKAVWVPLRFVADYNCAFLVLEKLKSVGCKVTAVSYRKLKWWVIDLELNPHQIASGKGDTFPMAVCEAAYRFHNKKWN